MDLALTFSPNSAVDSWGGFVGHCWKPPPVVLGLGAGGLCCWVLGRSGPAGGRVCVWGGPGCKERPEKHGLGKPTRRKGPCGPQLSRVCLRDTICPLSLQPSGAGLPGASSATVGSLAALARGLSLQPHGGPQPGVLRSAPRLLAPQNSRGWARGSHCACSSPPWMGATGAPKTFVGRVFPTKRAGRSGGGGGQLTWVQFCWAWESKAGWGGRAGHACTVPPAVHSRPCLPPPPVPVPGIPHLPSTWAGGRGGVCLR